MGRRRRRSTHHQNNNDNLRDSRIIPEQRPVDPDHYWRMWRLRREIKNRRQANKGLFEKAESKVFMHFKDCAVLSNFGDIKLEILHLIPLNPQLAPDLLLLRVLERESVLLGRIDRFDSYTHRIYIRDVEDGEMCFYFEGNGDVVKPGRFIAITNPQIYMFDDGKIGFCVDDETCVIFIDTDNEYEYRIACVFGVIIVFFISLLILLLMYPGSKYY